MSHVRLLVRCIWVHVLAWTGCLRWAKQRLRDSGAIVMLTFHRVLDEDSYRTTNSLPGIVIRECTFRELVRYIADRYEPVALADATPGTSCGAVRIVFTFDDGWRDNYKIAFAILQRYRVPINVFVCPGLVDRKAPFWPEQVVATVRALRPAVDNREVTALIEDLKRCTPQDREQYSEKLSERVRELNVSVEHPSADSTMSWDEIAAMDRAGVRFGSHTQTHQILTTVPEERVWLEIQKSKTAIESTLGKKCKAFAYPNGEWSPETQRILAEAGFTHAVTTEPGAWTAMSDRLAIPRLNVCEDNIVGVDGRFSPAMFEYMAFWKAWRATKTNSRLTAHGHGQRTSRRELRATTAMVSNLKS